MTSAAPQKVATTKRERMLAILAHFSIAFLDLLPGVNIAFAFIVWSAFRETSAFVRHHAIEAVNFNLVWTVPYVIVLHMFAPPHNIWAARILDALTLASSLRVAFYASQGRLATYVPHIRVVK